ncbi:MAG: cyclodeaminase/cyclohydrolase family protein [Eubacteriaceae bacterium]|nr:cyclodeaminase/cyclohydrolase family protein [Eubacteriaceae bacterium]MDD4507991.1 cyclodeaminase/cyclohydrolase family protein [Eubacteriaceae bacterium]
MKMTEQSCEKFVEVLASKAPTPGGGGASALVGAVGMALGSMVGSLTLGKQKYADVQSDIEDLMIKAKALQKRLLDLVEKDAIVFTPLSRAYGLPSNTPEEKAEKEKIMAECLTACCQVPLDIMTCCCEAIDLHHDFSQKGTAIAISDVGVGVTCCKAALEGASLNVFINTKAMKNEAEAKMCNDKAQQMLDVYIPKAEHIFNEVRARFRRS